MIMTNKLHPVYLPEIFYKLKKNNNISLNKSSRSAISKWFWSFIDKESLLSEKSELFLYFKRLNELFENMMITHHGEGHAERVAYDSMLLYLFLTKEEDAAKIFVHAISLGVAGLLHDIGFLSCLNSKDYRIIKHIIQNKDKSSFSLHPVIGANITSQILNKLLIHSNHIKYFRREHSYFLKNYFNKEIIENIALAIEKHSNFSNNESSDLFSACIFWADKITISNRIQNIKLPEDLFSKNFNKHIRLAFLIENELLIINTEKKKISLEFTIKNEKKYPYLSNKYCDNSSYNINKFIADFFEVFNKPYQNFINIWNNIIDKNYKLYIVIKTNTGHHNDLIFTVTPDSKTYN